MADEMYLDETKRIVFFHNQNCVQQAFHDGKEAFVLAHLVEHFRQAEVDLARQDHVASLKFIREDASKSHFIGDDVPLNVVKEVLAEIEEIGWDCVSDVSEGFDEMTITMTDPSQRLHSMRIKVHSLQCFSDSLSIPLGRVGSLVDAKLRFSERLKLLAPAWDQLDILDQNCLVLDPPSPIPRAVLRRRIGLLSITTREVLTSVFLEVKFGTNGSPVTVDAVGPATETDQWRDVLNSIPWESRSVFDTLQTTLQGKGISMASRNDLANNSRMEELVKECGVCYSYRLVDPDTEMIELPDNTCPDCRRPYHYSCILGWLRTISTTKAVLGMLVGECPYCGKSITIRSVETVS